MNLLYLANKKREVSENDKKSHSISQ